MKLPNRPIVLLAILNFLSGDAARILGIFAYHARSHFLMNEQILKGLAKRGHQVDVISHFPQKQHFPNYSDIISFEGRVPQLVNNMTLEFIHMIQRASDTYTIGHTFGNELCNLLELPEMQKFIKNPPKDPPYDLVITESFGAHCYMAFGHHLKVPVVSVSTCALHPWISDQIGNPDNSAYVPNLLLGLTGTLTFWERLQNTIYTTLQKQEFNYYTSSQDDIIRKHFGQDAPGVRELERSVALLLTNTHFSMNSALPLVPAVVEVGGLHIQEKGPELPPSLQKWLDESKKGFVYFSFGSMVKIESLPKETLLTIYKSIAKITPVRVLMKIAKPEELPAGLPGNVLTMPWISQIEVLKHRNIRAFVTHGGLMGTQEAVYYGVPLIGIPLFADQSLNTRTYVQQKIAISLDYRKITTENLDAALDAILNNPEYRERAKKVSAIFKDRPMSAIDTATFWIEYVLRNGATTLRSPILDLTWWQVALLDVYGFLLLVLLLVSYILIFIVRKLNKMIFDSMQKSKKL